MNPWKTLNSQTVLQDEWIHVSADQVLLSSGQVLDPFYRIHPKNWVIVMAITKEKDWVIVEQYRHGTGDIYFEFPAGTIDEGESNLICAQRELLEETGYGGGAWQSLGSFPANPAHSSNYFEIFLAEGVELNCPQKLDSSEEIEVHLVTQTEMIQWIKSNQFRNPHHQCAFFRYTLHKETKF